MSERIDTLYKNLVKMSDDDPEKFMMLFSTHVDELFTNEQFNHLIEIHTRLFTRLFNRLYEAE